MFVSWVLLFVPVALAQDVVVNRPPFVAGRAASADRIAVAPTDGSEASLRVGRGAVVVVPSSPAGPEDCGASDVGDVINVEDADKMRRPHMYDGDPIVMMQDQKRATAIQAVVIAGIVLLCIIVITGVACVFRRKDDGSTLSY